MEKVQQDKQKIFRLIRSYMKNRSADCSVDNIRLWLQEDGFSLRKEKPNQYICEIFVLHLGTRE